MNDAVKISEIAGAGGGGGCFRQGTLIQLRDGKTIPIEELREGDEVLSFDGNGAIHADRVTKVHYHADPEPILRVKFWRGEVFVTPNHWVLNQYNSFVEIGTLTTHDALVDGMGHLRPIIDAELVGHEPVWNLTVESNHTFIANGVRVHNGGHRARHPEIEGAGGGGGDKGGGGAARAAVEDNDSLQSRASIGIIDLIGEGEIGGLVDGAKSIFLNDAPLQNPDGSFNFNDVWWDARSGTQDQYPITGSCFNGVATPYAVGVQIKQARSHSVAIANPQSTAMTVVVTTPQLMSQDKTTGDIHGATINYRIEIAVDGSSYSVIGDFTISGKTRSRYQRAHTFSLPAGNTRIIRVSRLSEDSTSAAVVNELWFDSYVEIIERFLRYPNSALVAIKVDATQFSSVPRRSYLVNGLYIRVPSNYNPVTRTYDGVWNGAFKLAVSGNPAWVLYDLLTNDRYGLGDYIEAAQVDKATLYKIGRYCDELVSNGMGGYESRFTINVAIQSQAEAYKMISDLTSVFRGMGYWTGGMVGFTHDAPRDSSMVFEPANVLEGTFTYSGSSRKDRHSVALITWNDPTEQFKQKIEYVEDAELVAKFGVRKTDMIAFGCTSRSQAHRLGRWILYTEKYESQMIGFKVGMDSALVLPGEVVKIHDPYRAGKRMGGRIKSVTATSVTLDSEVTLDNTGAYFSVRLPDGSFVERRIAQAAGIHSTLTWLDALAIVPSPGAIYVISESNLVPMLARVVGIAQGDKPGTFGITAVEHSPGKYDAIEKGYVLEEMPTSLIDPDLAIAPSDLRITEAQYEVLPGVIGTKLFISWYGQMPSYEVRWRRTGAKATDWQALTTSYPSIEIDNAQKGLHEVEVVAINTFGKRSQKITGNYTVLGKTYAPGDVTGFVVKKRITDLQLAWNPVTDVDLAGYEVRVGPSWDTGEVLTARFMGTSMLHDQAGKGTYLYHIRSIDSAGNYSENTATYALDLAAPGPVQQFDCVQAGGRLEFRWRANPEIDVVGYEIREGLSWGLSTKVAEVSATSYTAPAGNGGTRTFWIKAIASPGIYSDLAMMTTSVVAQPSNSNIIFEDDEQAVSFPAVKHFLTLNGDDLMMNQDTRRGEYIFKVELPAEYRAQNVLYGGAQSVLLDTLNWQNATFDWNDPDSLRMWESMGASQDSITVRYQISPFSGLPTTEIDGWNFENSLASLASTATVLEQQGVSYQQGRYGKGVYVSDVSQVAWTVSIPQEFSQTFWITPKAISDSKYLTLTGAGSICMTLRYSTRTGAFYLESNNGELVVPYPILIDDPVCVGISQNATKRRLMIGSMGNSDVGIDEKVLAPLGALTRLQLY